MPVVLRTLQYYLHFESDFWECACVCMCVGGACKRERERTRNEQIGMRERASLFLRSFLLSLVCFSIEPCEHACDARGNKNRNKGKKSFFVSLVHCVQGLEQHCEALLLLCHFGANFFLFLLFLPHRTDDEHDESRNFHRTIFRFTEWKMWRSDHIICNGNWHAAFPLLMDVRNGISVSSLSTFTSNTLQSIWFWSFIASLVRL